MEAGFFIVFFQSLRDTVVPVPALCCPAATSITDGVSE
ncbi:hypothetical protein [Morganella morganii IS15]|nr:hypothetical protein CSB69_0064 [Morganella morganii]EMP51954.1 hypothetical protein C790_00424 [Morganella morganii SC01]CDK63240.1 hypothetical protein [Morganella morganii IS15]